MDVQDELKSLFLEDVSDLLTDAEQAFLSLEGKKDDPETIDKIFRLAHNIKGSAKAVGFAAIGEFAHKLESLLLRIKKREIELTTECVTLLLECNDYLRSSVAALKNNEELAPDEALIGRVIAATDGKSVDVSVNHDNFVVVDLESVAAEFLNTEAAADIVALPSIPDPVSESKEPGESTESIQTRESLEQSPEQPREQKVEDRNNEQPKTRSTDAPDESIRVSLSRLEKLVDNIGELVILQTVLNENRHQLPSQFLQKTVTQLAKISKEIQDISMGLRLVPLKQTFNKMQRIVRDTANSLGKQVIFEMSGEDTELDKTVVDRLGDPLVHLVRNAVDHGLESDDQRQKEGKASQGRIKLRAYHHSGRIAIEVQDDGRGLNVDVLRNKGIERGLLSRSQSYSDQEIYNLIFHPGFSTKATVTDISGRGVGLDVVKTNIEKMLQGEVHLETKLGQGTCFRIMLPLTLAIIDGMVVRVGAERYIVPLNHVHEAVRPRQSDVRFHSGLGNIFSLRGEALPMYMLGKLLGDKAAPSRALSEDTALVVRTNNHPYAVVVDEVIGRQQVVIKKLGREIGAIKGMTGGAILGDGCAAIILDLNELVHQGVPQRKNSENRAKGAA